MNQQTPNDQPTPRYIRRPDHARRLAWGDDFAGDAWHNTITDQIVYCVVGHAPIDCPRCAPAAARLSAAAGCSTL